jgi:hypothetical protein
MSKIISTNGFLWLDVTEKAKEIYNSGLFAIYSLYNDGSESLIKDHLDLNQALGFGNAIGIELGHINEIESKRKFNVEVNPFTQTAIISSTFNGIVYTQMINYSDLDVWDSFEMAWECFDIHFLYDDEFSVSIYPTEEGKTTDYKNPCIVHLKINI